MFFPFAHPVFTMICGQCFIVRSQPLSALLDYENAIYKLMRVRMLVAKLIPGQTTRIITVVGIYMRYSGILPN